MPSYHLHKYETLVSAFCCSCGISHSYVIILEYYTWCDSLGFHQAVCLVGIPIHNTSQDTASVSHPPFTLDVFGRDLMETGICVMTHEQRREFVLLFSCNALQWQCNKRKITLQIPGSCRLLYIPRMHRAPATCSIASAVLQLHCCSSAFSTTQHETHPRA